MEQRNGYFRITWKEQLAVCHLFAPKAEGVPVSYKELASFLDDHGISGYKERELAEAIAMGSDWPWCRQVVETDWSLRRPCIRIALWIR